MTVLARLAGGLDNYDERVWPGTDQKFRVRLLSEFEEQQAEFDAQRFFENEKIAIGVHNINEFESEKTIRKLYLACVSATGDKLTDTIDDFKKFLSRLHRDILVDYYTELCARCNPSIDDITEDDFTAIKEEIKKKPVAAGSIASLSMLRRLIITLAEELQSSPTDNGRSSSPSSK